jgi:hypothetical protein
VGPGSGLDAVVKRKIPCPCQESNPDRTACSLVVVPNELSRIPEAIVLCFSCLSVLFASFIQFWRCSAGLRAGRSGF